MTSVKAFNQTLEEFLRDLKTTFPEEKSIRVMELKFETGVMANNRMALDQLMPYLSKYAQMITSRDEQLFLNKNYNVMPEIDFSRLWQSELSDNTRKVIWDYLNTLLMLGTTISSLPQNMLSQIEAMAQNCVNDMEANGNTQNSDLLNAQQAILQNGMFQNMFQQFSENMSQPQAMPSLQNGTPANSPVIDKPQRKKNKK